MNIYATELEDEDGWKQEQLRDELAMQREALKALEASQTRPLTKDEAMSLAYLAGVANDFYKEIRQ
jgi:plasmid maintenance system antidote protein VapI